MGMDLKLVSINCFIQIGKKHKKKDPKGYWANYNYDWMFKPGAMAGRRLNMPMVLTQAKGIR